MSNIRYSFNSQIQLLCQSLCYRAFGVLPSNQPYPTLSPSLEQGRTSDPLHNMLENNNSLDAFIIRSTQPVYKCDIARRLYEHFRLEGFRYAQPGITPQAIAKQIEVHIKRKGDLQWQIDQFGNFIFVPAPRYLTKLKDSIGREGVYRHDRLQQFGIQTDRIPLQIHYFDYYLSSKPTLKQVRKIAHMQQKARILQHYNGYRVVRTVFMQNYNHTLNQQQNYYQIQQLLNLLLGHKKYQLLDYEQLYKLDRSKLQHGNIYNAGSEIGATPSTINHNVKSPTDYQQTNVSINETKNKVGQIGDKRQRQRKRVLKQYWGCNGENTIYYNKRLPHHTLINNFIGNQQIHVDKFTKQELVDKINSKYPGHYFKYKSIQNKLFQKPHVIDQCILLYGNLLDLHEIELMQKLLENLRKWPVNGISNKQIAVLTNQFVNLTKFPLNRPA